MGDRSKPLDTPATNKVLNDVLQERIRQHKLWGTQDHPNGSGPSKEIEDALKIARERYQAATANGECTWSHILEEEFWEALFESDPEKLRTELIQVAAVCTAWVESLDRAKSPKKPA